jgi:hypothetical protein
MKPLTLGYSPCPNDTFIFYALVHRLIDTGDLKFKEILLDVETLNQKALNADLDLTKISYHAFGIYGIKLFAGKERLEKDAARSSWQSMTIQWKSCGEKRLPSPEN